MKNNIIIKLLSSLPIILIMLYFIPFVGICLLILRYFTNNKRKKSTPIFIIVVGMLILIPKLIYFILDMIEFDKNKILYLNDIINSDLYNINFINYSKLLISVGVIYLIIYYILNIISRKLNSAVMSYINSSIEKDEEISRKNDMEIKIKQEKAKNTNYIKCPSCGSDNLLSEKFGTCKYCRRKLENKNYKI